MLNRISKSWAIAIVLLLALIITGITAVFTEDNQSETEIIGQKDAPTDIWVGEKAD